MEVSDGYTGAATGRMDRYCTTGTLDLRTEVNVPVLPKGTVNIDLTFPKKFRAVDISPFGGRGNTYFTVALPVDKGRTAQSQLAKGLFTVSLGVGESKVSRDHAIPAVRSPDGHQ